MPIDAAAEMAHSSELAMPRPAWAPARGSSTTPAPGPRRRGERPLRRAGHATPGVGARPGVEHHARARVPGLLLAADHQVAPARGRAPVDPAYVVALPILPDQGVVLADHADPVRSG